MSRSLAIVGAGNMGAALCRGLAGATPELRLNVADKNPEKLGAFADFKNVKTSARAAEMMEGADAVLIAVKPQAFHELCEELGGTLGGTLVISIMAGKSLATIAARTGSKSVVRAMPNLGVKVGRGMTAWIGSKAVTADDAAFVGKIFGSVGKEMRVASEELINAFTATAGCGPAYFFHLCDLLAKEATAMGFSAADARDMAEETLIGSAKLLQSCDRTAEEWVKAVASKGGATEAALRHLEEGGGDKEIAEAIEKALQRSRELDS